MTTYNWETVDVPRGAFISWGETVGQHVTGKILDYEPAGGTNFAGEPCPQLSIELVEPAASINKAGQRTDFPTGDLVVLNAGQVSLKRAVKAADPKSGDLIKITLSNLVKTPNGTVKEFDIKIARGAGGSAKSLPLTTAPPFAPSQPQAAPPF
jgi:hypothetical protein